MKLEVIFNCINNLNESFDDLEKLYTEKQKVLVNFVYADFLAITKKEEAVLLRIQLEEKNRLRLIAELAKLLNAELNQRTRFSDLLKGSIPDKATEEVIRREKVLQEKIVATIKINRVNMSLIEHRKSFLSEFIKQILSNNSQSLINRKI